MRPQQQAWARGVAGGVAILSLVAAHPSSAPAQGTDDPREAPEVRKLVITGVQNVIKRDLEKSISTQASECKSLLLALFCKVTRSPTFVERHYLDREEFERDLLRIRAYYWERGFRETTVDTAVTKIADRGVQVTFTIHENRPTIVRKISVDYDASIVPEKRIKKFAILKAGMPLDYKRLDTVRVSYLNQLWGQGYGDGAVDTSLVVDDSVGYYADIRIRLIPNRKTFVGPINVDGLEHVDRQTVLNAISLRSGELFKRGDQLESQRNLYESSLFRLAAVTVVDSGPAATRDSIKRIDIHVSESPLHEPHVGVGFTSIDFVQGEAGYTAHNLFGGARRLDVSAGIGNLLARQLAGHGFFHDPATLVPNGTASEFLAPTWSVSADFRQPAFLRRPKDQLGFSGFAHRRATPGIFVDRGYGGAVTFTRQMRERAPISATYRFEINRVIASDVYFCVNYGVCDTQTIGSLRSHQSLAPLSFTGFIDRSDIPLDPTRGYVARADFEHASSVTMSGFRYNRGYIDAAAYHHRALNVYSAHLRIGAVRALTSQTLGGSTPAIGVLHPRKRFYAGGASSVRGYADNQLGPRILTIDPLKLADAGCVITRETVSSCDPNIGLDDRDFLPQALGGTSVIEGSVEWRFPSHLHRKLDAAVFLDAGIVGESALQTISDIQGITKGTAALTPGFGFRYRSPVGPIRFDIGINPSAREDLAVVTEVRENGERKIIPLEIPRRWSPTGKTLLGRLTLHFSIGQPY